ncbi:diguanylate cyclase [Billgrantia gudaonensis]|uniref:PAS domain S-box-containing protein/diguanylate cyclase (GGDEF) domain-containing protein n=1 Tax=Billgrantia gudaonensis TaxID=376427 RepID=A0A1G8T4H4_9GAMM|nr:diguanylate cyclase [Halomonas gudaonensis]SDJ36301.1 PAS domain S-box-containing protein/diguanylate cyclase (GGDEF) domain-containing protein [Halomonas gudaonensis]
MPAPIRFITLSRAFCSLQGRLLLGLAATWLVIVGLLLALAWLFGKDLVNETNLSHLRYEARLVAEGLNDEVTQRQDALIRLAEQLNEAPAEELGERLRDGQALLAWFEGIMVTDRQGTVIADWPVVEGRVGLETRNTEYFPMVRHTRFPYVSEPFVGRASGESMVLMLVPRLDEHGEFLGMVGGMVNLERSRLFRGLESIRLGEGGNVGVFTASGERLFPASVGDSAEDATEWRASPQLSMALDGWQGEVVVEGSGRASALVAFRQIWPANWVVGVTLPDSQVYAPLGDFLRKLWWVWLGVALLLLVSIGWLVRRLLTPLHHLEAQIAQVGSGQRRYLELATQMDELRQVADTFNRLEGERLAALTDLRDREAFLDAVLASTPVGMFVADLDGRLTYMNPALRELLGLSETPLASDWWQRIHPDDRVGTQDLWRHTLHTGSDFMRQLRYLDDREGTLWLEVHASQVRGNGQPLGFVGMAKDITERRQQEALQRWEAEHDPLTGLLNRRGFERRLEEALAECTKTGTPSVLILFDLDHFKPINDEGGHALGDEMLRRVAQVVAWEVRRSDHVARQGGDEFAVLLPSCTLKQAVRIAASLRQAVSEVEVKQGARTYRVTLSAGLAALHEQDATIEAVLARADDAGYRAKAKGRNAVVVSATGGSSPGDMQEDVDALFR